MRTLVVAFVAGLLAACGQSDAPGNVATDPAALQAKHAKGSCGEMPPGTGLTQYGEGIYRGTVASMLLGKTEFRVRGGGDVTLTPAALKTVLFDVNLRTFPITVTGYTPGKSVIEWRIEGAKEFSPIPIVFLYERPYKQAQRDVDIAIREDIPIPGMTLKPSQLKNPKLVDQRPRPGDQ